MNFIFVAITGIVTALIGIKSSFPLAIAFVVILPILITITFQLRIRMPNVVLATLCSIIFPLMFLAVFPAWVALLAFSGLFGTALGFNEKENTLHTAWFTLKHGVEINIITNILGVISILWGICDVFVK